MIIEQTDPMIEPVMLVSRIEMCPMHETAEEMLEVLTEIFYNEDIRDIYFGTVIFNKIFEVISKARGEQND